MRIHEVLEACVEYVAYEGVLGSDVLGLQQHLAKKDASIDATAFAYLYTLLCQHPSIQITISTYPLLSADYSVQLGTAPLPAGYAPPNSAREVDFDRLYREGMRGRELAYHLAGEDFLTSKEAVTIKKAEQDRVRNEKRYGRYVEPDSRVVVVPQQKGKGKAKASGSGRKSEQILGEDGGVLMTVIGDDDGGSRGEVVETSDLAGLAEKWGSRLRIRCTENEIYYRLTGSHQKLPKVSTPVLHALQLAARSREKGITAIELGPMIGASQGTMHYYMKVLVEMGLCAKVPAVLHGSVTNLLLFHPFLELNENYRAIKKLGPLPLPSAAPLPAQSVDAAAGSSSNSGNMATLQGALDEEDDPDLSDMEESGSATALKFSFRPLTEAELMTGHLVKERLIQLLDQPALQNHLLKCQNLLALIGWRERSALRHRRAVPRHITALVMDGIVERLEVGTRRVDCLRLTKYNPNYTGPPTLPPSGEVEMTDQLTDPVTLLSPSDFTSTFEFAGSISLNRSLERQITDVILNSGRSGMIYSAIRDAVDGVYKRSVEFFLVRAEDTWVTPQLRGSQFCSVMESISKERHLRVFSVDSYRAFMQANGTMVDDDKHPALTDVAGRWADLYFRGFVRTEADFWDRAERILLGRERLVTTWPAPKVSRVFDAAIKGAERKPRKDQGTRRPRDEDGKVIVAKKSGIKRSRDETTPGEGEEEVGSDGEIMPRVKQRSNFYDDTVQTRGRPRKYIHVVDEDGKVNRKIIGRVLPDPSIPPVLIYVASAKKLVPAPAGYNGVGKPPAVTPEQMKEGRTPAYFEKFDQGDRYSNELKKVKGTVKGKGKGKAKAKAKGRGKGKGKAQEDDEEEEEEDEDEDDEEEQRIEKKGKGGGKGKVKIESKPSAVKRPRGRPRKHATTASATTTPPVLPEPRLVEEVDELDSDSVEEDDALVEDVDEKEEGSARSTSVAPLPATKKRSRKDKSPSVVALAGEPEKKRKTSRRDTPQGGDLTLAGITPPAGSAVVPDMAIDPLLLDDGADETEMALSSLPDPVAGSAEPRQASVPPQLQQVEREDTPLRDITSDQDIVLQTNAHAAEVPENVIADATGVNGVASEATRLDAPASDNTPASTGILTATAEQTDQAAGSQPQTKRPYIRSSRPAPQAPVSDAPSSPAKGRIATEHRGRIDFALVRRNNELVEALKQHGGVLSDQRFINAHREWAARVGGTDAPFAPLQAYRMDRRIFKLSIPHLEREGRIKQTQCAIPTTTGRWVQQVVIWLPETSKEDVDAYISNLTQATISAMNLPNKKGKRTQVEEQAFTEARVASTGPINAKLTRIKSNNRIGTPASLRRNALLKQTGVGATLLGYISGRWIRVQRFLEAVIDGLMTGPSASSKISVSPRIFALPLIFEEVPVQTFYQCIFSTVYDEELDEWLQHADNKKTRLKDVPKQFHPLSGGYAGNRYKSKYRTILTTLAQLGIMSPLLPCASDEAELSTATADGTRYFKISESVTQATHFIIHEYAPIYRIAADTAGLLGILPISQAGERERFWSALRNACTVVDINALQTLECHAEIGLPSTARISETLDLDIDTLKMMRSSARWRSDVRILPEQRTIIDEQIDWRTGAIKITTEEDIQAFAHENALSVQFVQEEFARRSQQAKDRLVNLARRRAESEQELRLRRERNQRSLRQKLAENRLAEKMAWEERIMRASAATGVAFSADLVKFVSNHTLAIPNRAKLSDKSMEDAVKHYVKAKEMQAANAERVAARLGEAALKRSQVISVQPVAAAYAKGSRRRHKWTAQDDELLIDAEAIIRARSRGRNRARQASSQIFPNMGYQPMLTRLKKILAQPGKVQYFERLEQAWYDLWVAKRGTSELRDDHPDIPSEFDLPHHIEYLRAHIRKGELRLGMTRAAIVKVPELPSSTAEVLKSSAWLYGKVDEITMESVTQKEISDDAKFGKFATLSLREGDVQYEVEGISRPRALLRACLKMIISTPDDRYDPNTAKALLDTLPVAERNAEITSMVEEKIFTKHHNGSLTTRIVAYTTTWHVDTEGPIGTNILSELESSKAHLERKGDEGMEWPGICNLGEIANLMEMTSEGMVDFDFDIDAAPPVKHLRNTYNTRKLADDAFEFDFRVKHLPNVIPPINLPTPIVTEALNSRPWQLDSSDPSDDVTEVINRILKLVSAAGPEGLSKDALRAAIGCPVGALYIALATLSNETSPKVFWAGYDTSRLVSAQHWNAWNQQIPARRSVKNSQSDAQAIRRVQPRRWIDISGKVIEEDWKRCLNGVKTRVMSDPGISESQLRAQLATVLDRMETNDALQYLVDNGIVLRKWLRESEGKRVCLPPVEAMDADEELSVGYWAERPLV